MLEYNFEDFEVSDWEAFLHNRSNTREIPYHGGGFRLDIALSLIMYQPACVQIYGDVVQAALNCWTELDAVERDEWEINPLLSVAFSTFGRRGFFVEDVRPHYNRLWQESPRPHSATHRKIALNSQGELPVTKLEVGLLFELPGWSMVATPDGQYEKLG